MTNGVVSIMRDGHVVMKIVTGNDGQEAHRVAKHVRAHWPLTVDEAFEAAAAFGWIPDRLVVITANEVRSEEYTDHAEFCAEYPLYSATFHDPKFNPRWESGISDYFEVVDV